MIEINYHIFKFLDIFQTCFGYISEGLVHKWL